MVSGAVGLMEETDLNANLLPVGQGAAAERGNSPREWGNLLKGLTWVLGFEAKLDKKEHVRGDKEKPHQLFKYNGEGMCGCFIVTPLKPTNF